MNGRNKPQAPAPEARVPTPNRAPAARRVDKFLPPSTMSSPTVAGKKPMHPLLASYLLALAANPLRTKQITSGTLCFLQEILANNIAGVPRKQLPKNAGPLQKTANAFNADEKALKMALYGAFVSAPLSHVLIGALQRAFAGKTGNGAKILQLLAQNLLIAPVQAVAYLASMALINGARSAEEIKRTIRVGLMPVLRITWITSPLATVVAQRFLQPELWVPFFQFVAFSLGTTMSVKVKKMRMRAEKGKEKNP